MDKKILYSLLITIGVVFACLYFINIILGSIFGEIGLFISMFATIIFTIIYCTQLILDKLDKKIN